MALLMTSASLAAEDSFVPAFLSEHCLGCHQGEDAEADLRLDQLSWSASGLANREMRQRWILIHDRVAQSEMPPDAEAISDDQRHAFAARMADAMHQADLVEVEQYGRGPMRRLTRGEYEQNLRDLLHLPDLDVQDMLPEDRTAHQTNKAAETLDMTRVQLAAYLDAADAALRQAIASGTEPTPSKRYFALATKMFPKAVDHAGRESSFYAKHSRMVPLSQSDLNRIRKEDSHDPEMEFALFRSPNWPYYGYPEEFVAESTGRYRVRFEARAVRQIRDFRLVPSPAPQPMTFRARQPSKADVSGDVRSTGGILDIQPEPAQYETTVWLREGETFEYGLLGLPVPHPITSHGGPLYYDFPPMPDGGHPGVAFRWIEIVGPLESPQWPPRSHEVLFAKFPFRDASANKDVLPIEIDSKHPACDPVRLIRRFAKHVSHVPMPNEAIEVYVDLVEQQMEEGVPMVEAVMSGYKGLLCSSHFLFLTEPRGSNRPRAIASRLSHFLCNTRPDEKLLEAAESQELLQPDVLRRHVDRLIDGPKFDQFIDNFTDHWLDLKDLRRDTADIRLYPEYRGDDYLVDSMEWETRAFVRAMFRQNLPIETMVDAEFAMINDRLAKHYELPPVRGSSIRKVRLPSGSPRGGLLTQAAILKVTANGTATSPVIRGAWMMDRILGDPPPPPPADVPAAEPDLRGAKTIREILSAHAADASCATCHQRFDPLGLALESFDVLGGYRTRYRSLQRGDEVTGIDLAGHKFAYHVSGEVDSSGQMSDGTPFSDVRELKSQLKRNPRQLARNLLERLITYSTGTPTRFSDRRELETLLDHCQADGYRVRDLVHALVQSRIFLGSPASSEGSLP